MVKHGNAPKQPSLDLVLPFNSHMTMTEKLYCSLSQIKPISKDIRFFHISLHGVTIGENLATCVCVEGSIKQYHHHGCHIMQPLFLYPERCSKHTRPEDGTREHQHFHICVLSNSFGVNLRFLLLNPPQCVSFNHSNFPPGTYPHTHSLSAFHL